MDEVSLQTAHTPALDSPPSALFSPKAFSALSPAARQQYLSALLSDCSHSELLFVSAITSSLLKRDFLRDLPPELALHVLSFIDEPRTLLRVSRVSRYWYSLVQDDSLWKTMYSIHQFAHEGEAREGYSIARYHQRMPSYRTQFRRAYMTISNWLSGGTLLRAHCLPFSPTQPPKSSSPSKHVPHDSMDVKPSSAIPTSLALDTNWVVVGLASSRIHIFSARTGVLSRTLVGHESGVWAVALVNGRDAAGQNVGEDTERRPTRCTDDIHVHGSDDDLAPAFRHALGLDMPPESHQPDPQISARPSEPAGSSHGWGQPNALVVSGGCDRSVRVWDVKSGYCIYVLRGHHSTIRCLKVFHGRPLAVTGSRDCTVRVWDIQRGQLLRTLEGHEHSVRCLDVCADRIVSGSYDGTCRVWHVDTGQCIHILRGHHHQIYCVAFDGARIVSGGIDTTVRVWDAETGTCTALLQGHTALVCQVQLRADVLVTGGSDGRVITFALGPACTVVQRLAAHDSSVTALQLGARFLVTGGNDGHVRLFRFDTPSGRCEYVRELTQACESIWKIAFTGETCVIMCKRAGKTVMELWNFKSDV